MNIAPVNEIIEKLRRITLSLKSTMDAYDNDGNVQAIHVLMGLQQELPQVPFQVLDMDVSVDPDENSYRCFWIAPMDYDVNSGDEDVKVGISPQTEPVLFSQLLSHVMNEIVGSYQASQGFRIGLYINTAYAMFQFFDGENLA